MWSVKLMRKPMGCLLVMHIFLTQLIRKINHISAGAGLLGDIVNLSLSLYGYSSRGSYLQLYDLLVLAVVL